MQIYIPYEVYSHTGFSTVGAIYTAHTIHVTKQHYYIAYQQIIFINSTNKEHADVVSKKNYKIQI